MKAKTIEEAKKMAEEKSLEAEHKDDAVYIIYCNRTEYFYIDKDSLIRLWEQLIGYYENGIYTHISCYHEVNRAKGNIKN